MSDERAREIDMGYTSTEFARVLTGNFSGASAPYQVTALSASSWQIRNQQSLEIRLSVSTKPPRKLGLLELPVLAVRFAVENGSNLEESEFYDRFFKYFHKGGG